MNLYFRFIYLLFKIWAAPKIPIFGASVLNFRALPTDCDINLHITNSRYLSFMDLGRTYLTGQLKLLPHLIKKRWGPVVQAVELTYLRPIMLGQRFKLVTRLVYWDDKYFYMEQRFLVGDQLYAIATVKGLFISKGKKIGTQEVVATFAPEAAPPPMPEFLRRWKELTDVKKNNQ